MERSNAGRAGSALIAYETCVPFGRRRRVIEARRRSRENRVMSGWCAKIWENVDLIAPRPGLRRGDIQAGAHARRK